MYVLGTSTGVVLQVKYNQFSVCNQYCDKHITVHTLRKTLATKLVRKGAKPISVQRILGHSKYDTTINYYSIISDEDVEIDYRKAIA